MDDERTPIFSKKEFEQMVKLDRQKNFEDRGWNMGEFLGALTIAAISTFPLGLIVGHYLWR